MKKILVTIVGAVGVLTLTACGGAANDSAQAPSTPAEASVAPAETAVMDGFPEEQTFPADLVPAGLDTAGDGEKWAFMSSEGAVGVFRLPSERSEYCKKAHDYLERSYAGNGLEGFTPYECVSVAVDNRQGSGTVNMYAMQLLDAEGRAYDSVEISDDKGWMYYDETGDDDSDTTLYNEGVELSNNSDGIYLNPGAKGETTMFFKELPADRPTYVYVMPDGGFEQVQALPVR